METTPWTKETAEAFRPDLVKILISFAWRKGNELYDLYERAIAAESPNVEKAYKLLEAGRYSFGHAILKKVQVAESTAKLNRILNEIIFLERLDSLLIDREWINNDVSAVPSMVFRFRGSDGKPVATLDLTPEFNENPG